MKRGCISIVIVFLCLWSVSFSFSQETTESPDANKSLVDQYRDSLLYGIDISVSETIKEITSFKMAGLEDETLTRMKETTNASIIIEGIKYFRVMEYHEKGAIDFALEKLREYQSAERKSLQYITFYLKDVGEFLSDAEKEEVKDLVLDIIDTDIPSIALPSLELIPFVYTEKNIPILAGSNEKDEDSKTEQDSALLSAIEKMEQSSASADSETSASEGVASGTSAQGNTIAMEEVVPSPYDYDTLYSTLLTSRYEETNIPVIKDQIIMLLGQIQAYNQLAFITTVASNPAVPRGVRAQALTSLAYFEQLTEKEKTAIEDLYHTTRVSDELRIRTATLEAMTICYEREKNEKYFLWLMDGLRDNDIEVRRVALESFYSILKEHGSPEVEKKLYPRLTYIMEHDPEKTIQQKAAKALALIHKGDTFLLQKIARITYLNTIEKSLIQIGLNELGDKGGIAKVEELVKREFSKKNSSIILFVAEEVAKVENSAVAPLVDTLLSYPDQSVLLHSITAIRKNNLTHFRPNLEQLSQDITQPNRLREKAGKVAGSF